MSWIIYSLISLVSFSIMIILITSQTKKGFSVPFTLAFVFGLWIPLFGFWLLWEGVDFFISSQVIIILIIGGILAVIANWCAFKSANDSPNPGFAFAIINSSPVLIAIVGKIFLQRELSLLKLVGILISVAGIIMLSVLSSGKQEKGGKWWVINSLIALLASAAFAVLIVILLDKGISLAFILFFTAVLVFPVYFFWSRRESNFPLPKKIVSQAAKVLILAGIFSVLGNWSVWPAAASSPNPGFAFAISDSKPALIALLAKFFLNGELSFKQIISILVNITGIAIVIFF